MPIRILPKDEQTQSESKWISKKRKPKSWITKKKKPTEWITKKKTPTEWLKRKPPTDIREKLTDSLSGGRQGKPHSSQEGRRASAGRHLSKIIARSTNKTGGRAGHAVGSIVKGAVKGAKKVIG